MKANLKERMSILRALTFLSALLFLPSLSDAQQGKDDLQLLGNFQSDSMGSYDDLYGYVGSAGNEYAILAGSGISIVNIEDPSNPYQVYYSNTWVKDVKTYQNHLYGVSDGVGGGGIMKILDLSSLPDTSGIEDTTHGWPDPLGAHNLFIDDSGRAFLFNSFAGNSELPIYDLTQDPMDPVHLGGYGSASYPHGGYVRNDTLYNADIGEGKFEIVDVSDPLTTQFLGSHATPGNATHSCWLSEDGEHLFTMDEVYGDFVTSYDISDPSNIQELDRTGSGLGPPSSPHNVYIENGYLYGSYYADGLVIWDVSRPHNMIRVAYYDTYPFSDSTGTQGCWGIYPWLPSGNIIASDQSNGLFILSPDLQRGCYLEGTVTDASDGSPIQNVEIRIIEDSLSESSELTGEYATGTDSAGSYTVVYHHPHYHNDTLEQVPLSHDSLTIKDVQLQPYPTHHLYLKVEEAATGNLIEGVRAQIQGPLVDRTDQSDPNGWIRFYDLPEEDYRIRLGKWGYYPKCLDQQHDGVDTLTISLTEGYGDDFDFDQGWQTTIPPYVSGVWKRMDPALQDFTSPDHNQELDQDAANDCGTKTYMTPSIDTLTGSLIAPRIDASGWQNVYIRVDHWLWTHDPSAAAGDGIFLIHRNGPNEPIDTVRIRDQTDPGKVWLSRTYQLSIQGQASDSLYVGFLVGDPEGNAGSYGAIDRFRAGPDPTVLEMDPKNEDAEKTHLQVWPIPFKENFKVRWESTKKVQIQLYDLQGRKLQEDRAEGPEAIIDGRGFRSGVYILRVRDAESGKTIGRKRVVKE